MARPGRGRAEGQGRPGSLMSRDHAAKERDFKGPVHLGVLERMGILDAVRQASVASEDGILVDATGRKIGTIPGRLAGDGINVPRGDLANILYERTKTACEYVFGDTVTALHQIGDAVKVDFACAGKLVIGTDGIHSNIHRLAFGPEARYVKCLGYHYALVRMQAGDDNVMYNEPGRMVALGGAKAPAWFVFASAPYAGRRDDIDGQKRFLVRAYQGARWRVPELMTQVSDAEEFHMDAVSHVMVDRYASGRVALVGDAACGNTLGGFGTSLAVVGA